MSGFRTPPVVENPTTSDLIRAVAAHGLSSSRLTFPSRPLNEAEWEAFHQRVGAERLSGLLGAAINAGVFPVTEAQRHVASSRHRDVMERCLKLESVLVRAQRALKNAGVVVRVLKGPAAANLDYRSASLRPFIDIDLLVPSAHFDVAVEALAAIGYISRTPEPRPGFNRRFGKGVTLDGPDDTAIDLHRTFVMGPFGLSIDIDDLWQASEAFRAAGHQSHALSPELRLIHACYHAILGDWPRRVLPHRDIAELVLSGKCDERVVREISHRWGADAVLALGIREAWTLFGIDTEPALARWANLVEPSAEDIRVIDLYARGAGNYADLSIGAVASLPRVVDKIAFVLALTFPQRAYAQHHHRSNAVRLLGALRNVMRGRRQRV